MWTKQMNRLFHESKQWKKETVFPNVLVTPELANELLTLLVEDKQRPLKKHLLKEYTEKMQKGKWGDFNGDNIRISNTGKVIGWPA